jgi:hypothetical protein
MLSLIQSSAIAAYAFVHPAETSLKQPSTYQPEPTQCDNLPSQISATGLSLNNVQPMLKMHMNWVQVVENAEHI